MDQFRCKVFTYETKRGEKPVDEFIKKQQTRGRSKIVHSIILLQDYGHMLGMPYAKALGNGLYELRVRGREELRVFYCFKKDRTAWLLHAFKKQTQKTPQKELDLALKRMKELTSL